VSVRAAKAAPFYGAGANKLNLLCGIMCNGSESFGTNAGGDLIECAYSAAFGPTVTLGFWLRLKSNIWRVGRGVIGQWDFTTQRRFQLTTGFTALQERRLTMFFGQTGTDTAAWSVTSTGDVLPLADGREITIFGDFKMDEAVAADRIKIFIFDHSTGVLTGPVVWAAPVGTPAAALTTNTAKLSVAAWNTRPGINALTCLPRAWGFHNVNLTQNEKLAVADGRLVQRGLVDVFDPSHTEGTTFLGRKGTLATLKAGTGVAGREPKIVRFANAPPLQRAVTVGPVVSAFARFPTGGKNHYGVSGKQIGDGAAPAVGTMNFTAVADAALFLPVDGQKSFIFFEGGTNDIVAGAISGANTLLRAMALIRNCTDGDKPNRTVLWSDIPASRVVAQQTEIDAFNAGQAASIATLVGEARSVVYVPQAAALDKDNDFGDANHWGAAGYCKAARVWYAVAKPLLPAAGAFRVLFLGDSHTIGAVWNEAGTPANENAYRIEVACMMARDGF
jgi:hypothetical protein